MALTQQFSASFGLSTNMEIIAWFLAVLFVPGFRIDINKKLQHLQQFSKR
jgi:hypothetical protein